MEYEFNKSFFENHGKKEEYYSKIFPSKLRDTFSDSQKEERATQIDYLEKEILGNNAIKIRVRPGIIKAFANLTGVHDFKGGGYRGDTIYLGHTSDLFNPQIVRHEGIHILQQRELGSSNLGGFINWAIESLIKGPKKYKQEHKGEKITNYDLSSKPPLELESYANQMNPDDINYIRRRKKNAYKDYDGRDGMKNGLDKIRKSNYDIEKEILVKKYENLVEELERAKKNFDYERISQVYKEKLQTEHDLAKLEDVMTDPKNSRDDRDMRVFNYLDKIKDVLCVIKLLDEKLKQLKIFEKDGKLEINKKGHSTTNNQFRATPKLKKDIELFKSEIANENLSYMLDDDFTNIEMIEKAINDLYNKCHEYRKTPTFIRLQERGQKEKNYSVELCGNESLTEEEKIQQIESEKERKKKNRKIDDEKRHRKKKYMVIPLLFKK